MGQNTSLLTDIEKAKVEAFLEQIVNDQDPPMKDGYVCYHQQQFVTPIWYRISKDGHHWEWTPDLTHWMLCSVSDLKVKGGNWDGH